MRNSRPAGISSRLHRAEGPRSTWTAPNGEEVDLPVTLDLVNVLPDGSAEWTVHAKVEMVDGTPLVTSVSVASSRGLDLHTLQAKFRWATPLEVVTRTVPALIKHGEDPYSFDFPPNGYPDAAEFPRRPRHELTDAFLEDIARRYLDLGRGYSAAIAAERDVSSRTAVSWVEKARDRGILSTSRPGAHGGQIVPRSKRPKSGRSPNDG